MCRDCYPQGSVAQLIVTGSSVQVLCVLVCVGVPVTVWLKLLVRKAVAAAVVILQLLLVALL